MSQAGMAPFVREDAGMTLLPEIERLYARWQIGRAVNRLDHSNPEVAAGAADLLRASSAEHIHASANSAAPTRVGSPQCWIPLRRAAFRKRSRLAVTAAELLYELGDTQGLYALLEQYSDGYMYGWFGQYLRRALQRVGTEKIVSVLEFALERLETPPINHYCWSLSLSVYALHALKTLHASVSADLWQRVLTVYAPGFEDLRTCRSVLSVVPPSETRLALAPPLEDWRVGHTLAAVRRVAVDALLTLDTHRAFDLLRQALRHPDPQVQITAIYGLAGLRDPRAYVLLQPFAADRRHPLSRDARRAIESLGTSQPDALTLVRASQPTPNPAELLRPAPHAHTDPDPQTLLRPTEAETQSKRP